MRKYEIMYIVRPNVDDETKKVVNERFAEILTNEGTEIVKTTDMGKRRLAYEINDFREGYYTLLNVVAKPAAIEEFDRLAKISEDIIRHIAVREEDK